MMQFHALIVDDQRDIRLFLRSGLQSLAGVDIHVTDVPSGEEAILVISSQPVDLLITDVRLPGISGLELIRRAVGRYPRLKVILMTGMSGSKVRRTVEGAGADACFFKPFELIDFLEAAKRCLGIKSLPASPEIVADQTHPSLPERLSKLHQELHALGVVLLDETGQVVAETNPQAEFENDSPMLSAIYALSGAAMKVGHLMGATVRDGMFFDGKDRDLVLAHIGSLYTLLVVLPNATLEDQNMAQILAALRRAVEDLGALLDQTRVVRDVLPSAGELPPELERVDEGMDLSGLLPELDKIFKQAPKVIQGQDIDAYWEGLSDLSSEEVQRADAISYEQARKLGLAPGG